MMSLNLQQYLMTLISEATNGVGFLNVSVRSISANTPLSADYALAGMLAHTFMLADMVLYLGIIATIVALGLLYRKVDMESLAPMLLRVSAVSIYCSLLLNLFGFMAGFDFLSEHSISIFEGSYTFNVFSQIFKVLMLLILGALYVLFPTVLPTKMRVLELPVLLQISTALCATVISSTNFALLLLALEGFSLTLYIMTALGRNYGGVTASVKYFAFGTLGSIFLF
jgi:NADH:ubiquinone oxidoreductase subunit 2 (subunit N)